MTTLTAAYLPTLAVGWTNSSNATYYSTDVATAACTLNPDSTYSPTPPLVCSLFGLNTLGVAQITALTVRVSAKSDAAGAVLSLYLARGGVRRGEIQTIALSTTLTEYVIGPGLFGTVLTDADCRNLQVTCFVTANDAATSSISYVSVRAEVPTGDAVPNAYSFTNQTGVALSSVITSDSITIAGTAIPSCISISNGEYELDASGVWVSADGSVVAGQTVRVRHTSSATAGGTTATTLTIGSVNGTFTTTTLFDTTPDAFAFPTPNIVGIELSTVVESGSVTINGINGPAAISVSGPGAQYSIGGGVWTATAGTISNGQSFKVRHTSSASYITVVTTTATVGGVSANFTSSTKYNLTGPNNLSFTNQTGVATGITITSNTTGPFSGAGSPWPLSITGGTYSKNGGGYTAASGTLAAADTINVRHTSAGGAGQIVTTELTVGNVVVPFSSTTAGGDITPDAFTFTANTNAIAAQPTISNAATITGINVATPVSCTNGAEVSVNGGAYAASGSITTGQTVRVRINASAQPGGVVSTVVTVGNGTATFTVTTNYASSCIDF